MWLTLLQIIQMLSTIETYSVLTTSRIEGIEPMCAKFQTIFANVKKKPYDILDHRKIDFDTDFEDFKSSIYDLEVGQRFMSVMFCIRCGKVGHGPVGHGH